MMNYLIGEAICEIEQKATNKSQRPFLPISFSRTTLVALYDTGADVCCISEDAFNALPKHLQTPSLTKRQPKFKAANSKVLDVIGKHNLRFKVGEKWVNHEFYQIRNLGEDVIIGINFIHRYHLNYDTVTRGFFWKGSNNWNHGILKVNKATTIKEFTMMFVQCEIRTDSGCIPPAGVPCMVTVTSEDCPYLSGGPAMVIPDHNGLVQVPVNNTAYESFELVRNEPIGRAENLQGCQAKEITDEYVSSVRRNVEEDLARTGEQLTEIKRKFIMENTDLSHVPEEWRPRYLELILKHHAAVSKDKLDLGRTEALLHDIELRDREPIYVQQFKIPDAQRDELHRAVAEWLKLGVVQPTRSKYNSPLFCVAKKDGGLRIVQDFRALNAKTLEDKYSMKDISECIHEIGKSGSSLFTTIDLTAGFWQMLLKPSSRPYTAFTVPGRGQFQWVTTPMGLLGAPASFQRLMEKVVHGIPNIQVYIDDLLGHTSNHSDMLNLLDQVLFRLVHNGIKMNLQKCKFGSPEVTYLGFQLTPEGIKPGKDKLKAVARFEPPSNTREVRQFLGLCNFFRAHIKDFAFMSSPLTELTRKECSWKAGPLPAPALKAFHQLQQALISEPVVAYPRKGLQYALTTDACTGTETSPGGIGAILSQIDEKGNHRALGYASRKLTTYEKNYTPFLLEMAGCLWGIEHFKYHLKGRPFFLFTDHQPLTGLSKVHKKTYDRLTEAMNTYNFQMVYKKGEEMPADYLSRHVVAAISWSDPEMINEQGADDVLKLVKRFLSSQELPDDRGLREVVQRNAEGCFLEDGLIWKKLKGRDQPVLALPRRLIKTVLSKAHGDLLSGHNGILQTKERILQNYYWSGMDTDIHEFIQQCHKCQVGRRSTEAPHLLSPLPQCTEPQQRVHADLFGPLKTSIGEKKYILSMTDAFTKYVELVVIPSKEASVVAKAIFDRWICRFGCPLEIVTDQGKEFCAQLTDELFKLLDIHHSTTTAYHPQCNSQAEVANKTIAKYLSRVVDDTTLDWESYIGPLMFAYNTSFHRSIKNTPFFLTHGMEARQPGFDAAEVRTKFSGPQSPEQLVKRLQEARDIAQRDNQDATLRAPQDHDRKAQPHSFVRDQLVLLEDNYFASRNAKLAPKFTGPHRIIELKGESDVVIKMGTSGRKLTVHVNRLKPYHVPNLEEAPVTPPPLPPRPEPVQPPRVPPRRAAAPFPQPPPTEPEFSDPVATRTRSKRIISALDCPSPTPSDLTGEGVQRCQESAGTKFVSKNLINETEEVENWVLVVRKPKRRQPIKKPIKDMWDDELMTFEWTELVPREQPNQQQPVQPDPQVDFDYDPDQPPDDFSPPASPQGSAGSPPSPDSRDDSWRLSDSDTSPPSGPDPDYVPSTTPPSSSDSAEKAAVGTSRDIRDAPTPPRPQRELSLPPEFRPPNKTLLLKPAVPVALPGPSARPPPPPPKNNDDYIYADVVLLPHNFGDTSDLPKATSPKPVFNPNPFGSLFSRSSRSKTTLPSSVLNTYPTERKSKR